MTIYTGTNGNDNLTGTGANDVFRPLLGEDTVNGQGGVDRLEIDYSSVGAGQQDAYLFTGGNLNYAIAGSNRIDFNGIQQIVGKGGSSDTNFQFSPNSSALKVTFDAGEGMDTLSLDALPNQTISGTDHTVKMGTSTFTNFEAIGIQLFEGTNKVILGATTDSITAYAGTTNTMRLGGGDDNVQSMDSVDNIDGGDGDDRWYGFYGTPNLTFTDYAGKLSNGTVVRNVEHLGLISTGGSSTFNIRTFISSSFGSGHNDVGNVNFSAFSTDITATIIVDTDFLDSYFSNGGKQSNVNSINTLNYVGGAGSDQFAVTFTGYESGQGFNLNGGAGNDSLTLSLVSVDSFDLSFSVSSTGVVTSNIGTFAKFEQYDITGGAGDDIILGVASAHGGDGDDLIGGTAGNDQLDGGDGFDTVTFASAATAVQVSLADHQATGAGSDTLLGFEAVVGSRFADILTGDAGDNSLAGGAGSDTLTGGAGADTLTGGTGADQFRFVSVGDFASGNVLDLITDFSHAERDKIVLDQLDLDSVTDGRQGFTFIGSSAFHVGGTVYELRVQALGDGGYRVEGDTNHDGTADIAFEVGSKTVLVAGDFVL